MGKRKKYTSNFYIELYSLLISINSWFENGRHGYAEHCLHYLLRDMQEQYQPSRWKLKTILDKDEYDQLLKFAEITEIELFPAKPERLNGKKHQDTKTLKIPRTAAPAA